VQTTTTTETGASVAGGANHISKWPPLTPSAKSSQQLLWKSIPYDSLLDEWSSRIEVQDRQEPAGGAALLKRTAAADTGVTDLSTIDQVRRLSRSLHRERRPPLDHLTDGRRGK